MKRTKIFYTALIFLTFVQMGCSSLMNRAREQEKSKLLLQLSADQLAQRELTKALDSALESIKYDPSAAPAYNHLALIYMELKRYEKAEESFKKALEIQPEYPEVYNNYGVLMNRLERYSEAIPLFERALTNDRYLTPENALTNIGYSYFKMGNLQKSKSFHQRALDIVPQFCLASKNLGDVYSKEKNLSKASDYYQKALANCPLYQETQYKLGLVQMKMGQKQVAKAQFEKLLERHKNGPYVERSQEVLKLLK